MNQESARKAFDALPIETVMPGRCSCGGTGRLVQFNSEDDVLDSRVRDEYVKAMQALSCFDIHGYSYATEGIGAIVQHLIRETIKIYTERLYEKNGM